MTNPTITSNGKMILDARRVDLTAAIASSTPTASDLPADLDRAVTECRITLRRARKIAEARA